MTPPPRFNIHFLRNRRCIWRLFHRAVLLARSPRGRTFKTGREAKTHARLTLKALQTIDLR